MKMNQGGPGGKQTASEKPKNYGKTIFRLLGYMKKSRILLGVTAAASICAALMQVLTPKMLGNATTAVFEGAMSASGIDFSALRGILLMVALLYAGVFLCSFLQERIMTVVSNKIGYQLRKALKEKMNVLPVSYFDQHSNGELMSVAVNDMENIVTNLQQGLTQLIQSGILVFGVLAVMLMISPALTLVALLMVPASLVIMKTFSGRTQKNGKTYYTELGSLNGKIEEAYQAFDVVKSFHMEADVLGEMEAVNDGMYVSGWKMKFFGGSMMPSMMLIQNIIYVCIAVLGTGGVIGKTMTIGNMQAFLQYSGQFSSPLAKFGQIWGNILSALVSAERIFDILDAAEVEERTAEEYWVCDEQAKVVFDQVEFGYTEEPLFQNFSMTVEEGATVAIVGKTGAGKTTLIQLLERFYEVQKGSIRIDGMDISAMPYGDVRSRIGMVLQDTWLFSGTVFENIRYGNEQAEMERVVAAAKAAFADEFIQKLPDGYDTMLEEGGMNLSQGQRQLMTIARAFVADPEILILDEATSNVDSRTEAVIQKAMRRLLRGRTNFVIAHRLSTIYDADCILVMEQGDIVEAGTHEELLQREGTYAQIYWSQFEDRVA